MTHDDDTTPVRVERVLRRVTYAPGKRAERALLGKLGFLGGAGDSDESHGLSPTEATAYRRAHDAYYARHPTHPGQPAWRLWPEDFLEQLAAPDAATVEAFDAYRTAHRAAVDAWRAANPRALPVHPDSAAWRSSWDALTPDWSAMLAARNAFIEANSDALAGMLAHPLRPLQRQSAKFLHDHWEALGYAAG